MVACYIRACKAIKRGSLLRRADLTKAGSRHEEDHNEGGQQRSNPARNIRPLEASRLVEPPPDERAEESAHASDRLGDADARGDDLGRRGVAE